MSISEHTKNYWGYEYSVTKEYMIPLLQRWGVQVQGASAIDVGCGEGGGLCAIYDAGAFCDGFDVDEPRVDAARALLEDRNIILKIGNLYDESLPFSDKEYDLVILHDVFEHLELKGEILSKLRGYMKPQGKLMITFPPYYSAYGAHQQLLSSSIAKLPFVHLIPFVVSQVLPRLPGESQHVVEEIQKLGKLKMGMAKFEDLAYKNSLSIVGKQAYLIGPNHIRFGLKPIAAGTIAEIPIIGEIVTTGVVYLLSKEE